MNLSKTTVLFLVLLLVPLVPSIAPASGEPESIQGAAPAMEDVSPNIPTLGEIIPTATDLSLQLTTLQKDLAAGFDVSGVQDRISRSKESLKELSRRLEELRTSQEHKSYELVQFNHTLELESKLLEGAGTSLIKEIEKLANERYGWIQHQKKWAEWQSTNSEADYYEDIKPIFINAQETIQAALNLLSERLRSLLAVQQELETALGGMKRLMVEVDSMIVRIPVSDPAEFSPPMFSSRYLTILKSIQWYRIPDGGREAFQLLPPFLEDQGWLIVLQLLLVITTIVVVFRNRDRLERSKHWKFIAQRPFSTGLVVGILLPVGFSSGKPPLIISLFYLLVGVPFIRLMKGLTTERGKIRLVMGLIIFVVIYRFLFAVGFPDPLLRIYVFASALLGFGAFMNHARKCVRRNAKRSHIWGFRLGALFFFMIIFLAVWGGKPALAGYIMESSIRTFLLLLGFWFLTMLAHGVLEWLVDEPWIQENMAIVRGHRETIISRSFLLTKAAFGTIWFTSALTIWDLFDDPAQAFSDILSLGFTLGEQKFSLGLLILAAAIFYGSFVLSSATDRLLTEKIYGRQLVSRGVQQSLTRLIHYALVFTGFMIAMSVLGFDFTKLTIIFGALSVGIGFGLQNVVNNFVCGLIMLFERPIRVGDVIEFGGVYSEVKNIGLRATWVRTFDNEEIVVPNSDLITNQVTNCTLTDRQIRRKISVGVAYGSDIPLVMETLMDIARTSPDVLDQPEPMVLFKGFGDSALDFQLLVWIGRFEDNLRIQSDLCQEIDRRFREAGIEIAFPQMDLHLRSVDEEAGRMLTP